MRLLKSLFKALMTIAATIILAGIISCVAEIYGSIGVLITLGIIIFCILTYLFYIEP